MQRVPVHSDDEYDDAEHETSSRPPLGSPLNSDFEHLRYEMLPGDCYFSRRKPPRILFCLLLGVFFFWTWKVCDTKCCHVCMRDMTRSCA